MTIINPEVLINRIEKLDDTTITKTLETLDKLKSGVSGRIYCKKIIDPDLVERCRFLQREGYLGFYDGAVRLLSNLFLKAYADWYEFMPKAVDKLKGVQ